MVLIPGAGQTRRSWFQVARKLVHLQYRVISLDLRGHGESDWAPDGDYLIDAFVGDLEAVMSRIDVPMVLVGASIGGITALLATSRNRSNKIAGLVLVDVVPDMRPDGLQRIRDFMSANTTGFANVDEAADLVAAYLPNRPRPADSRSLERSLRRCPDGRLRWHWDPAFHASSAARVADGMFTRMAQAAGTLAQPALLISGRQSEVVDEEGARRLLATIPRGQWVNLQGASHMVAGDGNAAFSDALILFLELVLPGVPMGMNEIA